MSQTKEVRYTARSITPPPRRSTSRSPPSRRRSISRSPPRRRSISRSRSRSRDRSRSRSRENARNPGNNLYVTGLSTRVTSRDLEKLFSKEGKVQECHVVLDPRTKESRGFAFVTMETVEDARRCIRHLHRTVLEGRLITVEKAYLLSVSLSAQLRRQVRPPRCRSPSPSPLLVLPVLCAAVVDTDTLQRHSVIDHALHSNRQHWSPFCRHSQHRLPSPTPSSTLVTLFVAPMDTGSPLCLSLDIACPLHTDALCAAMASDLSLSDIMSGAVALAVLMFAATTATHLILT